MRRTVCCGGVIVVAVLWGLARLNGADAKVELV